MLLRLNGKKKIVQGEQKETEIVYNNVYMMYIITYMI